MIDENKLTEEELQAFCKREHDGIQYACSNCYDDLHYYEDEEE